MLYFYLNSSLNWQSVITYSYKETKEMKAYSEMTRQELLEEHRRLEEQYKKYRYAALSLDMSRGKPSPA